MDINFAGSNIQNNLNEIVRNLAKNYSTNANIYNKQVDFINKQQTLVETNNQKLNQQLDQLNTIQDQIALKTRIIQLNEESEKRKQFNKKLIIGLFIVIIILIIPVTLMLTNTISPALGGSICVIVIIIYLVYMFVLRKKTFKEFVKPMLREISSYEQKIKNFIDNEKNILEGDTDGDCICPEGEEQAYDEEGDNRNIKREFVMDSNGPFYYYDGSAPPQQIQPQPMASLDFVVDGKLMTFPREVQRKLDTIKSPLVKEFFRLWLEMLQKQGISLNDPKFKFEKLNVTDLETTDIPTSPYWNYIKLPMISGLEENITNVCQRYDSYRKNVGMEPSAFLNESWMYFIGEPIPQDVYNLWLQNITKAMNEKNEMSIALLYVAFMFYMMQNEKFIQKYGNVDNFFREKVKDLAKVFAASYTFAEPNSVQIFPLKSY